MFSIGNMLQYLHSWMTFILLKKDNIISDMWTTYLSSMRCSLNVHCSVLCRRHDMKDLIQDTPHFIMNVVPIKQSCLGYACLRKEKLKGQELHAKAYFAFVVKLLVVNPSSWNRPGEKKSSRQKEEVLVDELSGVNGGRIVCDDYVLGERSY